MVLLSGASYEKFYTGATFINFLVGTSRSFYYHQLMYKDAISSFFQNHLLEVRNCLIGKPLTLAVDVRYDSPGD